MARGTKKKPLTARQQELVDLMKAQPDMTAAEIADTLEMSPGAVYQQSSRLRAAGHLPPKPTKSNGRRGRRIAPATVTRQTGPAPRKAEPSLMDTSSNGSLTLEEHLVSELQATLTRLSEVSTARAELAEEETTLAERQKKLEAASAALAA